MEPCATPAGACAVSLDNGGVHLKGPKPASGHHRATPLTSRDEKRLICESSRTWRLISELAPMDAREREAGLRTPRRLLDGHWNV